MTTEQGYVAVLGTDAVMGEIFTTSELVDILTVADERRIPWQRLVHDAVMDDLAR